LSINPLMAGKYDTIFPAGSRTATRNAWSLGERSVKCKEDIICRGADAARLARKEKGNETHQLGRGQGIELIH
jgi:hypothetical protein